jgi:hypothetical protein
MCERPGFVPNNNSPVWPGCFFLTGAKHAAMIEPESGLLPLDAFLHVGFQHTKGAFMTLYRHV